MGGYWPDMVFKDVDGNKVDTKKYGSNEFHGRTHPAIAYMSIIRFTNERDVVYIPFGGSGTEVDVCNEYNRKWYAIDLNPQRKDIDKGDATTYKTPKKASLVIAHPPYEDVVNYGGETNNLSKRGDDYNKLVSHCCRRFYESLGKDGKLVVIIGSVYRDREEVPLDYVWYERATESGFRLIGRIVRDFGETKAKGKNKNLWKYRLIKFNRFKLENDFVLVFEKKKGHSVG